MTAAGRTIQTTGLVHEAFLRLVDQRSPRWQNRSHFFAIASNLMRRVLVDQARVRLAQKRGGGKANLSLDAADATLEGLGEHLLLNASDPSAQRSGDERMSCAQITAELKQQQYAAQDKTKVAEATTREEQKIIKKEEAILAKRQAEARAAVAAVTAADTATEVATAGLVRGHALNALEKSLDAQDKAEKERVIREDLPTYKKMNSATADLGSDFGQQLQANPRLGRLMQLADSKHCKGGG